MSFNVLTSLSVRGDNDYFFVDEVLLGRAEDADEKVVPGVAYIISSQMN